MATLLDGLRHGFRIGYTVPRSSLVSSNLVSSYDNPDIVSEYLAKECARGHTTDPFLRPPCVPFRSAGIGVVPKKSGGHRLIVHLSAPVVHSINYCVPTDRFRLMYNYNRGRHRSACDSSEKGFSNV